MNIITDNQPVYRYDKLFEGIVTDPGGAGHRVEYRYHVRPMGRILHYDFARLQADLLGEGIVGVVEFGGRLVAQACGARVLVDYWADRIREDPFYLLDGESRSWAEPIFESRQRRFMLEDFE